MTCLQILPSKLAVAIRRLIIGDERSLPSAPHSACTAKDRSSTEVHWHGPCWCDTDTNVITCEGCGQKWDPR